MLAAIRRVQEAMQKPGAARAIGGIYMEGPYMNPKYGASPEKNQWRGSIDFAQADALIQSAGEDVLVWAIAPEREGVASFVRRAKAANTNVRFAVGHSEATPTQIAALKQYGLMIQTHCTNATGAPCAVGGTRACGPDEACFYDPDMYAEVICDSCGIHVHPDMLRLIHRIKGDERVILISDGFVSSEQPPESLKHITDLHFDANGGLCGSKLTLDVACRNMMRHTGIGICQAFAFASRNPARAVGLDAEVGSIAAGKRANFVLVDGDMRLHGVWLEGEWMDARQEK
jgi:N-acetylglucosamine-6-phosphate deacetylase